MQKELNWPGFVVKRTILLSQYLPFQEHRALFIEASAKEGTNTNEALIELTR